MKKIISVILIITPFFSFGQDLTKELYNWFDEKVAIENTNIHQGEKYTKGPLSTEGKHSFFKNAQFAKGEILYKGERYSNVYLKYDLFKQELIARFQKKNSKGITIQFFKKNIESFELQNASFFKVNDKDVKGKPLLGFYEQAIALPSLKLLIKHTKYKVEVPNNGRMFYKYLKNENVYYLMYKEQYTKVKSKRSIISVFPSLKKQINTFYKVHSSLRKTDFSTFLVELIKHLENNNNL